jgi:hypothetical protein
MWEACRQRYAKHCGQRPQFPDSISLLKMKVVRDG